MGLCVSVCVCVCVCLTRSVYEVDNSTVIPTYILTEGNGRTTKGMSSPFAIYARLSLTVCLSV